MKINLPVALTIAGSDSGGGAGIQADIKTFQQFGVFGTSAITCLTAQNPEAVRGISAAQPGMVALQIMTVCEGFSVSSAKTGMLYSAPIIRAVAKAVKCAGIADLVVDPVMFATSGGRLLLPDAVKALCSHLIPMARIIAPNLQEAEILFGGRIKSVKDLKTAAREIGRRYGTACVVKGGHLPGDRVVDVIYDARSGDVREAERVFTSRRVFGANTHGTGCMFSAALTACLARGDSLSECVRKAKRYVYGVLKRGAAAQCS